MSRKRVRAEQPILADDSIRQIRRRILRWGRQNFQNYPWRQEENPWLAFLAEFLLQRTRAKQVATIYPSLSLRFPTARALLDGDTALITANLGLHFRAAQLIEIAKAAIDEGGSLREDFSFLRALTGVGDYTASAWLSLHRGQRAVLVDANVARWLSRLTGRPPVADPRRARWLRELAELLTPQRAFKSFNYGVLDLTMTICVTPTPHCEMCPLRLYCHTGIERSD